MPKKPTSGKSGRVVRLPTVRPPETPVQNLLWRIDRLERHSELVQEQPHLEAVARDRRVVQPHELAA